MFQNLALPAAPKVRDSSSVTPCIGMKNDGVLYHQMSSLSPKSKHSAKSDELINKGGDFIEGTVHKCCTHVNKAMSQISNCCHYFLSNLCS